MAPQKRKREDRPDGNDATNRPSPHRPDSLSLAQRTEHSPRQVDYPPISPQGRGSMRGRGRGTRGGRGGYARGGPNMPSDGSYRRRSQQDIKRDSPVDQRRSDRPQHTDASTPNGHAPEQPPHSDIPPQDKTTSQPSAVAPTDLAPQPDRRPRTPPPFEFEYVTSESLQEWEETGMASLMAQSTEAYANGDAIALSNMMQELIRSGLDHRLSATDAGTAIKQIIAGRPDESVLDTTSLFLDALSMLPDPDILNPAMREMVIATEVSPEAMRHELEEGLLQALGLTRDTFGRMFIRKQTNLLYRQSNYNLLREESEGYSKLITELFTVCHNEAPSGQVVGTTLQNVTSLIGTFDLDAGRVLDVILDVFGSVLIKHYRFFVKFLRASSYWPQAHDYRGALAEEQAFGSLPIWAQRGQQSWTTSDEDKEQIAALREQRDKAFWEQAAAKGLEAFFGLGGRKILDEREKAEEIMSASRTDDARSTETRAWIVETGTLPPPGNAVAAQLLGFKLRFYSTAARSASDALPPHLIYLAALLIKIGFMSLRDLYAHLFPEDELMPAVKEKQLKEKEERDLAKRPGGSNALARAGALADDTAPPAPAISRLRAGDAVTRGSTPPRSDMSASKGSTPLAKSGEEAQPEQLPEPSDQKVQLLKSLLCIGALPEALFMLGRFPWLLDVTPDLPEHINRILHHCLSKVYEPVNPLNARSGIREPLRPPAQDQSGLPKGSLRLGEVLAPKVLRWAQPDKNDQSEGIDYRFYWDDWSDNIPVCQNVDDVFTLSNTLLNLVGVKIGQDTALLVKFARIAKHSLTADFGDFNQKRWLDLFKRIICPALSLTKAVPGIVNEVFDVLKMFPTHTRYSVYAEWFQGQTSRLPDVSSAFGVTRSETRDILKRISKTNIKQMARALAKTSCASPGIVFEAIITQIESYDNLIDVVVDCGRYFTFLGYDVLTWTIVGFLGREGRSRVGATGYQASSWLQALATFIGRLYKRWSLMNPLPILQYVVEQLRYNNYTDLRVLRDIITYMTGVTPDTDFSESQVLSMAGGPVLQAQTLKQVHDRRDECKPSARRLIKALTDGNIASQLLVSVAQARQVCVFNQEEEDSKILAETYDIVSIVFAQCNDMLATHMSTKDFLNHVPDAVSLIADHGVEAATALSLHRKNISQAMAEYDTTNKQEQKSSRPSNAEKADVDQDVDMNGGTEDAPNELSESTKAEDGTLKASADEVAVEVTDAVEGTDIVSGPLEEPSAPEKMTSIWHPVLEDLMISLRPLLSEGFETSLSLSFFTTFWQLSLSDIVTPTNSYTEEQKRQMARIAEVKNDRLSKQSERQAQIDTYDRLVGEMKAQIKSNSAVNTRIRREKAFWFQDFAGRPNQVQNQLHAAMLQECFLPRLLISPVDSYFAQKLIFSLHKEATPGFRTLKLFDMIFHEKTIVNVLYQCTDREVENYGRFLNDLLKTLGDWHAKKTEYEKMALGRKKELPGFAKKLRPDGSPEIHLDYEDFRRILFKWHRSLFNALKSCLSNYEYVHSKNAVKILSLLIKTFPAVNFMGSGLKKAVEELIQRTAEHMPFEQPDTNTAASVLRNQLTAREKHWVPPTAFHLNDAVQRKSSEQTSSSAKAANDSNGNSKTLNATAAPFEPSSVANSSENPEASTTGEPKNEDGEVADGMQVDPSEPVSTAQDSKQPKPSPQSGAEPTEGQLAAPAPVQPSKDQPASDARQKPSVPAGPGRDSPATISSDAQRGGAQRNIPRTLRQDESPKPAPRPTGQGSATDQAPNGPRNGRLPPRPGNYTNDGPRQQEIMHPPPARPPTDRGPPRYGSDPSRLPRHMEDNFGRLNAPDPTTSTSRLPPSRAAQAGPRYADRRSGVETQRGPLPSQEDQFANQAGDNSRSGPPRPSGPRSDATEGSESTGVHPSRLQQINPVRPSAVQTSGPPSSPSQSALNSTFQPSSGGPPSGPRSAGGRQSDYGVSSPTSRGPPMGPANTPTNGNFNRSDARTRQFRGLQDTLNQGGQSSPVSNGNYGSPGSRVDGGPLGPRQENVERLPPRGEAHDGPPAGRDLRSRPGSGRLTPSQESAPAPDGPSPVDPKRAAFIGQGDDSATSGRLIRDDYRSDRQPGSRPRSPARAIAPDDRGASIRGRASAPRAEAYPGPGPHDSAGLPPRGSYNERWSDANTAQSGRLSRSGDLDAREREDVRPRRDLREREEPANDRNFPPQEQYRESGRHHRTSRDQSREHRESERDKGRGERDAGLRPQSRASDDLMSRGGDRDGGRRGRELVSDAPQSGHRERERLPRDAGGRDRRDERGYGREELMPRAEPFPPRRGGPPMNDMGGPGPGPGPFHSDGRGRGESRGDSRRGDFERDVRERDQREGMGSVGRDTRKREWNGDGAIGPDDGKRPRRSGGPGSRR